MKISSFISNSTITVSFEVFPPKVTANYASTEKTALEIASLKPDYMSVTYGAGGSTRGHTVALASGIQKSCGVPAIAHLTCVGATKADILHCLREMEASGIDNILALRGDRPDGQSDEVFTDFRHASELVRFIRDHGDFCVGGACYPEGHPEAATRRDDLSFLREKVDAGCDYLVTQMFFDNNIFYSFLYRAREAGITVPIIPGIMPITRAAQVKRAIELSGSNMPERFRTIADFFGGSAGAMEQAGIAYATDQIIDLIANGIRHIHVYTMNKPHIARAILGNLSEILQ